MKRHESPTSVSECMDEPHAHVDKQALRMLNLLFALHVSPTPLSTEQIIGDKDMGYGSGNPNSDRRKFLRDRDRLAECGVVIHESAAPGASMRETSLWTIDRARTHAGTGILEREDAEAVLAAIDGHFALHGDDPIRWPLQRARVKLRELAGHGLDAPAMNGTPTRENTAMKHIWSAYRRRRAARFTYRDAQGAEQEREVEVYAVFTQGSHTYLVGRCLAKGKVLTFRTDRILAARKTPDTSPAYAIPSDFHVESFQFLPFDFSPEDERTATFSFPAEMGEHELALLTRRRGKLGRESETNRWLWTVGVCDFNAAATFTLEHTHRGMRAESPDELVSCVRQRIQKAVENHGA